jgi:hypothetical protein
MSWQESVSMFAYGFVAGYFWYPLWTIGKKIVSEARKAKEQW